MRKEKQLNMTVDKKSMKKKDDNLYTEQDMSEY